MQTTKSTPSPQAGLALEWAERDVALASWAMAKLANRCDVWGGYNPLAEVSKKYTKPDGTEGELGAQTTRPRPSRRGKVFLTEDVLARHFRGHRREDLVGLHSTTPDNTSRWGALDIDWHGPTSTAPEVNRRAALAWYDGLVSRGFHPLLVDSNGAGGFHLWVIFAEPIPTPRVFHFLKALVADHDRHGMGKSPECFPKQALLGPGRFGNWLRLPGRHHTHDFWSRIWDGCRWLEGDAAIEFIVALSGNPRGLVPEPPPPPPPPPKCRTLRFPRAGSDNLAWRIAAYMAKLPAGLGKGMGRDDVAYHFAAFLGRDLDLPDEVAMAWLMRWDSTNNPPKGEAALKEILGNARTYGHNEVGCGLGLTVRGGHLILTASTRGMA
jgi:hypothetical protein